MDVREWVERNTNRTLSEGQVRACQVLATTASNGQIYNVPLIGSWRDASDHVFEYVDDYEDLHEVPLTPPVEFHDGFVIARLNSELATFDGGALTRLVLAAHYYAVRVSVSASYTVVEGEGEEQEYKGGGWISTGRHIRRRFSCLEVMLHPREREGETWKRHPTIQEVLGLDRDKVSGDDSLPAYWDALLRRAKEFGLDGQ